MGTNLLTAMAQFRLTRRHGVVHARLLALVDPRSVPHNRGPNFRNPFLTPAQAGAKLVRYGQMGVWKRYPLYAQEPVQVTPEEFRLLQLAERIVLWK
jgi:hypothetical protein